MKENTIHTLVRCSMFVLVIYCFSQTIYAQTVKIGEGILRPTEMTSEKEWFLNTRDHEVFFWNGVEWDEPFQGPFFGIETCNDVILLRKNNSYINQGKGYYVIVDANGKAITTLATKVFCGEKIFGYEAQLSIRFCPNRLDLLAQNRWLSMNFTSMCSEFIADTIQGMVAFCLPQYSDGLTQSSECEYYRNWGMLGTNGQWLIQPVYDAPFRFRKGFAKVRHYGQKRKINEKGEFVE